MSTEVCLMGEGTGEISLAVEKAKIYGDGHRRLLVVTPRENYRQI